MLHVALILALSVSPDASPYEVDPAADTVATAGMLGLLLISEAWVKPTLPGGITCELAPGGDRCDPSRLNALDRTVPGNYSKSWRQVSDVTAAASLSLPVVLSFVDSWASDSSTPLVDASTDTLVMVEAVAAATLLTNILKFAVRRPRPTQYTEGTFVGSVEHQLSFPSGHATSSSAAVTAYATTFALRHPESPWRYPVVLAAVGLAGITGYARVGGGMHFYTDVIAGALLGGSVGFLVPWLHRRGVRLDVTTQPSPDGSTAHGVALSMRF